MTGKMLDASVYSFWNSPLQTTLLWGEPFQKPAEALVVSTLTTVHLFVHRSTERRIAEMKASRAQGMMEEVILVVMCAEAWT